MQIPQKVINLAAQAGVRYSIENPLAYINTNLVGFGHVLEGCRHNNIEHLVYASSSSVYGSNTKMPFSIHDNVDHPLSLYAASKKANELMAHTYSHLYNLPTTGLRFFTVYGPWGRPDMALFKFTKAILEGKEIKVFNKGDMLRDFTYIDDIVSGFIGAIENPLNFEIINLGCGNPVSLLNFINVLEQKLEIKAKKIFLPMQPGDVPRTHADISKASGMLQYSPKFNIEEGVSNFVDWYKEYYGLN